MQVSGISTFPLLTRSHAETFRSPGFYTGYEWTKRRMQRQLDTKTLPVWATLTAGGVGGLGYWLSWYGFPLSDPFRIDPDLPFGTSQLPLRYFCLHRTLGSLYLN